jgi:murein DD-endopeptidase MepM/ murein hydrolase activator NlpD
MAISSPINIQNVSGSIRSLKLGLNRAKQSVGSIKTAILNRTIFKRQAITGRKVLQNRRTENIGRRDQEDILEATGISGVFKRAGTVATESAKGFLGRILDFITTMLVGWLLYNLPTILTMVKDLIKRVQSLFSLLQGFISNVGKVFGDFGNIFNGVLYNVTHLDFLDSQKKVQTAMKGLESTFDDFNNQFEEGFKLLTTPLGEGKGEEPIPPTGTNYIPSPEQAGEGGLDGGSGGKGGKVSPQSVYSYLKQLGVSDIHALGILANIEGESGFQVGVSEKSGGGGIGLFQYTYPSRKSAFLRAVPNYRTNWKGQIDFAIKSDPNTPLYLRKQFNSPEEAADDWMRNWENPSRSVYTERRRKHNAFIKSFKSGKSQPTQLAQASAISQQYSSQVLMSTNKKLDLNKLGFSVGERAGYSQSRGRVHAGRDIAIGAGTPVSVISDATITSVGYESGYGNYVTYIDANGVEHLYGHLKQSANVKVGDKLRAGTIIGYAGSTGRSTGPHLHWEVSRKIGEVGRSRKNVIDPIESGYSASAPFGGSLTLPKRDAQISSSQNVQNLQTTRAGQQIIYIDDRQPMISSSPRSAGGGQASPQSVPEDGLNSLIKMQMLLDLAYT